MRRLILVLLVICTVSMVQAEKLGVLTEVLKPDGMQLSGERLYIIGGSTIFVYSLKELGLAGKFGKDGEGPGEMIQTPLGPNSIGVIDGKIIAEGLNKLIYYSKDFKYLKEVRKKGIMMYKITPVDENYVAVRMAPGNNKIIFTLLFLDADLNEIKELYKYESFDRRRELLMVRDTIHYAVYKDKIYAEKSDKGFLIDVFDKKGDKLYEIKKDFEVPEIKESDKKAIFNSLRDDPLIRTVAQRQGGWEKFEKSGTFTFPRTFPCIQDLVVADGKIYVSTFERKVDKEKYIIMDLKGKIISTCYMPITQKSLFSARSMGRENRYYAIGNNKFYYLVENEDAEKWELHAAPFK
jgi:hypothetical protein